MAAGGLLRCGLPLAFRLPLKRGGEEHGVVLFLGSVLDTLAKRRRKWCSSCFELCTRYPSKKYKPKKELHWKVQVCVPAAGYLHSAKLAWNPNGDPLKRTVISL